MAKENIQEVETAILLKRKKFITLLAGLYIGILLVWIGLIIYDFVVDGESSKSTMFGGIGFLALFWLPFYMLRKVNAELQRRKD